MAFNVKIGGAQDIDAAVQVYVRSGTARRGVLGGMPQSRIDQVHATLEAPATWFFIARDARSAVGMAAAMPSREGSGTGPLVPGACYLDLIFVVPERWGEGVGSLLMDTVLGDARLRGFSRISLLTHDDNDRAQTLYRSRGFERTGWSRLSLDPRNGVVSEWARDL